MKRRLRKLLSNTVIVVQLLCGFTAVTAFADDAEPASLPIKAPDSRGRSTAVALNYCRASFHRIRKNPTKPVIYEEREKILNNLSLNGIADAELIKLYAEVLDEVGQIPLQDREQDLFKSKFDRSIRRDLAFDSVAFGLQLASAQYMAAMRTGANSWWDYRNQSWSKEFELLRIDKAQVRNVVEKSSLFLDTFWRLAQKKNIPDRWLVRGDDLDRLKEAVELEDLDARLRVLKRMKPFMEAYPPYWYYVGRTQQALGKWEEAAKTYSHLADVGAGFFRHDDMLATAMANRAAILDFLKQDGAVEAANESLYYSADVWQANLVSARVLERHGKVTEAEDAILRNLDVNLESERSLIFLMSLYYHSKNVEQIKKRLSDVEVVAKLPIAVTLTCASLLPESDVPKIVPEFIQSSLLGALSLGFSEDDFVFKATPNWNFQNSTVKLECGSEKSTQGIWQRSDDSLELRFREIGEFGTPLKPTHAYLPVRLYVQYPNAPIVRLSFDYQSESPTTTATGTQDTGAMSQATLVSGAGFRVSSVNCGDWKWSSAGSSPAVSTPQRNVVPPPLEASRKTFRQGYVPPPFEGR